MSNWRDKAMCRVDPSLWDEKATTITAVHICMQHCPVLNQCRTWAVGARLSFIVAGGIAWGEGRRRRQVDADAARRHGSYCLSVVRALEEEER